MKNKLFMSLSVLFVISMMGFAYAVYLNSYEQTVITEVTGGIVSLSASTKLPDSRDLDVSTALSKTNSLTLNNLNGAGLNMIYSIDTVKVNNDEANCPDFESDCITNLVSFVDDSIIIPQGSLVLATGLNKFKLKTTCEPQSCPQSLTTTITMVEQ